MIRPERKKSVMTQLAKVIDNFILLKELKKTYNVKSSNIRIFTIKHNCEDRALTISVNFKKRTSQNKFVSDLKFNIEVKRDFPNTSPEIFCTSNFIFPTLYDNRNLIPSILGKEWNPSNRLEELIELIPQFCERVFENTTNKYLVYYGDYKIDEVYDVNHFLCNSELQFFKCVQFLKSRNTNNSYLHKKERYIVLSDVYFLLFDPAPNFKNMAKLIFWGDIRYLTITKTDNYHENEKAHSYVLEWINENSKIISFEVLFFNSLVNQNFMLNPIQDFIDAVEKKANKLKENFRAFLEDFYKPIDLIFKSPSSLDNLNSFIKYNENKFSLYKSSFLANYLLMLYKIVHSYFKKIDEATAKNYEKKIMSLQITRDLDNKIIDNNDVKYNIKNNYGLSRSYSNTYHEDFV